MIWIHEHNDAGQHRIVAVEADGTNTAGEWVDVRKLATHHDLCASADPAYGLPAGVFKTKEVPHQVLA